MSLAYIAQAADHDRIEWIGGKELQILLDGSHTRNQVTVVRSSLGEGSASPLHLHHDEDEMFVILRGHGIFWVGDECREVGEGGAMFLPRGVPHAYRFTSPEVDLLTICTPSGMERFFRTAGRRMTDPRPDGWEVTMEAMAAAAIGGGQEILGPPPG
ncbi:Cupin 2 conserved barrel domain protein [Nostocoides japonicum T1-X7]|uniref:Cupin 2 conserved barrel domain protein n=1 Tax=Nostocoides japonicum T1-X7 TaxID=1194083 RepID=A0A077M0B4_9MICO|nr:cupin domain-containing protein [Tetrasphaera japonica]CCH79296.1 Cupin 2 conserved barrel domain protein [Tetrasphaera japonica T1-X7]